MPKVTKHKAAITWLEEQGYVEVFCPFMAWKKFIGADGHLKYIAWVGTKGTVKFGPSFDNAFVSTEWNDTWINSRHVESERADELKQTVEHEGRVARETGERK